MKIAITGARGLVGSRIVELLDNHEILNITSSDADIKSSESIRNFFNDKSVEVIIHMAAKADVDGCENEKDLGEDSDAWKVNVIGSRNVAEFCKEKGIRIVYISTDFVFDGSKPQGESYKEDDAPNPINFYAKTKYEGEKAVINSGANFLIARIGYPYRAEFEPKKDFVRAILGRLKDGLPIKAVKDHIMCPTFIDDIAFALEKLMIAEVSGIYHVVGSSQVTPYEAANLIAEKFNIDRGLISETTRDEYFSGKALRPFNLYLNNDKIRDLGINMRTFEEGLESIKI